MWMALSENHDAYDGTRYGSFLSSLHRYGGRVVRHYYCQFKAKRCNARCAIEKVRCGACVHKNDSCNRTRYGSFLSSLYGYGRAGAYKMVRHRPSGRQAATRCILQEVLVARNVS